MNELYKALFEDLVVDTEENQQLMELFQTSPPPKDKLIFARASAFRIGSEFLSDDKATNVKLLKCINVVVHDFEMSCLE